MVAYTVPGMKTGQAVTGPNFIAVHTMLDPQVDAVRAMVDESAERIAALGGSPCGTPGALVAQRDWDDYSIGRAGTLSTADARTEKSAARRAKK